MTRSYQSSGQTQVNTFIIVIVKGTLTCRIIIEDLGFFFEIWDVKPFLNNLRDVRITILTGYPKMFLPYLRIGKLVTKLRLKWEFSIFGRFSCFVLYFPNIIMILSISSTNDPFSVNPGITFNGSFYLRADPSLSLQVIILRIMCLDMISQNI